jgi:hypothetical protein
MKDPADWMGTYQANNVKWWDEDYTNAIAEIFPWVPDTNLLQETVSRVFNEYGVDTNGMDDPNYVAHYLRAVTNAVYTTLASRAGPFRKAWVTTCYNGTNNFNYNGTNNLSRHGKNNPGYNGTNSVSCSGTNELSYNGKNELEGQISMMLQLADQESQRLFAESTKDLKPRKELPSLTSTTRPVGVDLSAYWTEDLNDTTGQSPASTNQMEKTPGGVSITIQEPSTDPKPPKNNEMKGQAPSGGSVPDFKPDQQVTLNLSTVLDSASTLDRIDYVSTYVYVYPWPFSLDGGVVLEREFWRNFFASNAGRDPLEQTNAQLTNDIIDAIDDLRVRVHDISTTVTNVLVNFGTEQQSYFNQNQESARASGATEGIPVAGQVGRTAGETATETSVLQQQLDQRSTFIDCDGDFFRITQRGMRSVDLAGRFKDILTLHIPKAVKPIHVLILNTNTNTDDADDVFYVKDIAQPLYSEVNAITFSVVVARQTAGLRPVTAEQFGLEDSTSAKFIVGVTGPKRIKLWHWEGHLDRLTTRDLNIPDPVHGLRARFPGDPEPAPIYLAPFDDSSVLMRQRYQHLLTELTNSIGQLYVECGTNGLWRITNWTR